MLSVSVDVIGLTLEDPAASADVAWPALGVVSVVISLVDAVVIGPVVVADGGKLASRQDLAYITHLWFRASVK